VEDLRVFAFKQDNTKSKSNDDDYSWWEYGRSFAVADGVSRTCKDGYQGEDCSSYPAAAVFCHEVIPALMTSKSLCEPFALANAGIERLNRELHGITPETVDYLHNDYLSCVGVAGKLSKGHPHKFEYGYIGDCGILVYDDAQLYPKFLSENPIGILEQFREGWGFRDKDEREILWRRKLRNRPNEPFMTYGALTGELSALEYVKTGSIELKFGDIVILFSDGMYPFIFDVSFRAEIMLLLRGAYGLEDHVKNRRMKAYLNTATCSLRLQGVKNLDDDRTFIAFTLGDRFG